MKRASFGMDSSVKAAEFCFTHALPGMVNVRSIKCAHAGCKTRPIFAFPTPDKTRGELCAAHALVGMVDVVNKKCMQPGGCSKQPSYGKEGDKRATFCAEHALAGLVNIVSPRCSTEGCLKHAAYGLPGSKNARVSCLSHAGDGMVLVGSLPATTPQNRRRRIRQQQQVEVVGEISVHQQQQPTQVAQRSQELLSLHQLQLPTHHPEHPRDQQEAPIDRESACAPLIGTKRDLGDDAEPNNRGNPGTVTAAAEATHADPVASAAAATAADPVASAAVAAAVAAAAAAAAAVASAEADVEAPAAPPALLPIESSVCVPQELASQL